MGKKAKNKPGRRATSAPIEGGKPTKSGLVVRPRGVKALKGHRDNHATAPLKRPSAYKGNRGKLGKRALFEGADDPPPLPQHPNERKELTAQERMALLVEAMDFRSLPFNGTGALIADKVRFLQILTANMGIWTPACAEVGKSRIAVTQWMQEDEVFANAVAEIDNIQMDVAEQSLLRRIQAGDTTAIIFYLKTKGKKRGYGESAPVINLGNAGDVPFRADPCFVHVDDLRKEVPQSSVMAALEVVATLLPSKSKSTVQDASTATPEP